MFKEYEFKGYDSIVEIFGKEGLDKEQFSMILNPLYYPKGVRATVLVFRDTFSGNPEGVALYGDNPKNPNEMFLYILEVDARFRNEGIGQFILGELKIRAMNGNKVLRSSCEKRAITLYTRMWFKVDAIHEDEGIYEVSWRKYW